MDYANSIDILTNEYVKRYGKEIDTAYIYQTKYDDLFSLVNVLYTRNDVERAILVSIKLIRAFPNRTEIYYVLSLLFEEESEKCEFNGRKCLFDEKTLDDGVNINALERENQLECLNQGSDEYNTNELNHQSQINSSSMNFTNEKTDLNISQKHTLDEKQPDSDDIAKNEHVTNEKQFNENANNLEESYPQFKDMSLNHAENNTNDTRKDINSLSYVFYKYYAATTHNIEILKIAFQKSINYRNFKDALFFIKRIQKHEKCHEHIKSEINLLTYLYKSTNDFSYYTRSIFAKFEEMRYVGFFDIMRYENVLSLHGIKRAIKIVYQIIKDNMENTSMDYLKRFLSTCFDYEEYEIFLNLCNNKCECSFEMRLKVLIAMEAVGMSGDMVDYDGNMTFNVNFVFEADEKCKKRKKNDILIGLNSNNVNEKGHYKNSGTDETERYKMQSVNEKSKLNFIDVDCNKHIDTVNTKEMPVADLYAASRSQGSKIGSIPEINNFKRNKKSFAEDVFNMNQYFVNSLKTESTIRTEENIDSKHEFNQYNVKHNVNNKDKSSFNENTKNNTGIEVKLHDDYNSTYENYDDNHRYSDFCEKNNIIYEPDYKLFKTDKNMKILNNQFLNIFTEIKADVKTDMIDNKKLFDLYDEYMINNSRYILDRNISIDEPILTFLNESETYSQITEIHFLLCKVLLKRKKYMRLKIVLNNIISRLSIFEHKIDELCLSVIKSYKLDGDLHEISLKSKALYYLSLFFSKTNRIDKAIALLVYLNAYDDGNDLIKHALNEVYLKKGENDKALIFEQISCKKKKIKLTSERVIKIRRKYEQLCLFHKFNKGNNEKMLIFVKESNDLIKDFFNNEFIFKDHEFRIENIDGKIRRRRKRIYFKDLDLTNGKTYTRKERRLLYREYRDLHGLSFDEWSYLIKTNFYYNLNNNNYKKAIYLIRNFACGNYVHKSLTRFRNKAIAIGLIGMKYSMLYNDFDSFIFITVKMMSQPYNVINFFCNFFPNYHEHRYFKVMQRNLMRLCIRRDDQLSAMFITKRNINNPRSEISPMIPTEIKKYFITSLYPRFIHKKTADALLRLEVTDYEDIITLAVIFLKYSTSKKEKNVDYYARRGFELLHGIKESDLGVLYYNLGRAYHSFAILGLAEFYYKKAVTSCVVGKYAIYNLLIIYKDLGLDDHYFRYEEMFYDLDLR